MRVVPRPQDAAFSDAHQLTFETCKFVVAWTEGIFHDSENPRDWELILHIGNGVAGIARLGNYIVRHTGFWEIMTCDEFDRRYAPLDRPGCVVPMNGVASGIVQAIVAAAAKST